MWILFQELRPIRRDPDASFGRRGNRHAFTFSQPLHPGRSNMPTSKQAVAVDSRNRRVVTYRFRIICTVEVLSITADDYAEPVQVEVRIPRLHRIPRPLNKVS